MVASANTEAMSARRGIAFGVVVLTGMNLFNYIDRYVVAAVIDPIKSAFTINDAQAGWLTTSFLIVYFVTAPLFGRLGDTRDRRKVLAVGVAIWSLATGAAGLAVGFKSLLVARSLVGVGEAAYGTIAPALLADYFIPTRRNKVLSLFNVAVPVGSALGFVLGGAIAYRFGWRAAFLAVGLPGLVLAALVLGVPDPPRGALDDPSESREVAPSLWAALKVLAPNGEYVLTVLGFAAFTFAMGGLANWMPTFLKEVRGIRLDRANELLGVILAVAGLSGTVVGGLVADGLRGKVRHPYLMLSGVGLLAAFPFAVIALRSPSPAVIWPCIFVAAFLAFLSTGPIGAVLVNCVQSGVRAVAMAVCIFVIHILGDALAGVLIGHLSVAWHSLAKAVLLVPVAMVLGAVLWIGAARFVAERPAAQAA